MRPETSSNDLRHEAEILGVWEEYRESGDSESRDRLVLTFAPLVKYLAYAKVRVLPPHVRVEELISSGLEALIRSLERYDPAKGATLEQFLWMRIRGAITDELRRQDPAPRSLRKIQRQLSRARREFRAIHHRQPSDEEACEAIGITGDQLRVHELDVVTKGSVGSLNVVVSDGEGSPIELGDLLVAVDADPEAAMFGKVDSEALSTALSTLTPRERRVIELLHFHEMSLVEVGQIIGVSDSRVCQINRHAKDQLLQQLAGGSLALAG